MPELPEVETIARQLDHVLEGKVIDSIEVKRAKSFIGNPSKVEGLQIETVSRKAKMLILDFKKANLKVLVHLKMTGQLIWRPKEGDSNSKDISYTGKQVAGGHPTLDWVQELPSKHTRVVMTFSDGSHLFFNDLRVFGWMKILSTKELEGILSSLPPDVIDSAFSLQYFRHIIRTSGRAIKIILLDGKKLGGVGNIYANDALWLARINPKRPSNKLSPREELVLYKAVITVIKKGIKYGGATSANYVNAAGLGGKYQEHFLVYKQNGLPCRRCKTLIGKTVVGGRGTYWCPKCQK